MKNIKRIHLIYPSENKISTPHTIGRNLKLSLENFYEVKTYFYDEYLTITPGKADVLIGHWHPNPFSVFRMSTKKKGWKRIIALAPFCPDHSAWQNAFGNKIIEKCDSFLAISGNAWIKRLKDSPFRHWEPKIIHIDLAVDRLDFPFIKKKFNPSKKRRFLYVGHTAWYKNTSYLEKIAKELPDIDFAWIGGDQSLKNIKCLGKLDFSSYESKSIVKDYDFLITVGSADANPTTILEAMAWGLIPVCSVQSGYEGFSGIQNISIDNLNDSVKTIIKLQSIPEEKLKIWQNDNLDCIDSHFNWDRFCSQVLNEIESNYKHELNKITKDNYLFLNTAAKESPNYWKRPINLYRFLKKNFKYAF